MTKQNAKQSTKEARGNTKANKWALVINDKEKTSQEAILVHLRGFQVWLLNYNFFRYVFTIIHDKDPNKRTHLHAFLETEEPMTKSEVIGELVEGLGIEREQISLEPTNSEVLMVQYLTHKNQPTKEPYSYEEIKTNNQEELDKRYNLKYKSEQDQIKEALFGSKTLTELIEQIGVQDANKYRGVWNQLKHEQEEDIESLQERLEKLDKRYNNLLDLVERLLNTLRNGLKDSEKRLINYEQFEDLFADFFL